MHRAAASLVALLALGPLTAAGGPSLLERETTQALRDELRATGVALDDLAAAARDTAPADLPLRTSFADAMLASPLDAPDGAWAIASRIAQDVGARGSAGWEGSLGLLTEQWGADGEGADSCGDRAGGRDLASQHIAAAEAAGERWSKREVNDLAVRLHPELNRMLGALADHAVVAACRVEVALAGVPSESREALLADADRLLMPTAPDLEQREVADRLVRAWSKVDRVALIAAARGWTEAVEASALALSGLDPAAWPSAPVIWRVGLGEVWIGSPTANSGTGDPVLLIDPGGDDHWRIRSDATALAGAPVRGWIDLGGDDVWRSGPSGAGAGVFGVGAGVDLAGDDVHAATDIATGAGVFGIGTWLDAGGHDVYGGERGVQGFGLLGAGLLRDTGRGDDVREAAALAQGAGLPGGLGVLHDDGGIDRYLLTPGAEPDLCAGGCGQGAGIGLRPLLAGGIGVLVDDAGDDLYTSGRSSQAAGRWHGLGVLRDGGGDDTYLARNGSIASADRQGAAVLIDSAGDDRYLARSGSVATAGRRSVAWLVDLSGFDLYSANLGVGWSEAEDAASFLVDVGGSAHWAGGLPMPVAGHPRAARRAPPISAVVGRAQPASDFSVGGLGSSPTTTVAEVTAALTALAMPMSDPLDDLGERIATLIRRGAPPDQLLKLAGSIAADATRRERSPDDDTVAWHLEWLGWLARTATLASSELEATAAALADHPAGSVRAAVWDARASLAEVPDLEFPPEEAERLATAAAVVLQREEDPEVRAAAARAAGAFGAAGVASSLVDALLSTHLGLRRSAEAALVAVCSRTDGVAVARGLYRPASESAAIDPVVRDAVLRVLGATGQRDAVELLIEVLSQGESFSALAAAIGLARADNRDAARALASWTETAGATELATLRAVGPPASD